MKEKKVPMRKCLGCNENFPKKELIRVVKNKDGEIFIDSTGKANGRGAYICRKKECYEKAWKSKRLNKSFSANISDEIYENLLEEI